MDDTNTNHYKRNKKLGTNKAFTLVELIIVITILAILATIAFMSFQGYNKNARDGNRATSLKTIETGLDLYSIQTGVYPEPEGTISTGSINTIDGEQILVKNELSEIILQEW
ncbi:MAG: type II secretion system protein [Candidatus Altimarinota bacterium]